MKKLSTICLILLLAATSYAQEWQTDFTKAKELAAQDSLPIVLVFQGSDWCAPCIKLDKEIWSTEAFQSYAKNNFVMLKVDFPKRKKNALDAAQQEHNNKLAETYNTHGYFPYVVVLDKDGTALGATGYIKTSPQGYIDILESLMAK